MMPNTTTPTPEDRSERLDRVVTKYLKAVEAGEPVDPQEWIARHPDLAEELRAFFAGEKQFNRLATPLQTPAALGTVRYFGDYELVEEIGRGGMGVVYKARQVSLNRAVALKMLLSGHFAGEDDLRRFRTEAEAAARLDHPNILPVYEVGEHNGLLYFTMKLIDGSSLAGRMDEFRQSPRKGIQVLIQVARGVHHAHQRGILHRDLKPSNVLLSGNVPYIADFGLARKVEADSNLTQTGAIVGTPSYMAPEQAQARKDLSTAIDVYSLGAILYEVLTGRPPFSAPTAVETILQVLEKEPVAPHTLQPNVDRDLETIALKCLDKTPQKRYDSAAALADDLERWQRGEPILARRTGTVERTVKWVRRHAVVSAMAAAILFVLLGGIAASSYFAVTANLAAAEARKAEAFAQGEQERADIQAKEARRETQRADKEAREAKAARADAVREAVDAKTAREKANLEAKEAKWQARQANDARHALLIDQALRARQDFDYERMGTILTSMPSGYETTWETGYIRGLWERHTFPIRTLLPRFRGAVTSVAYTTDGSSILTVAVTSQPRIRRITARAWDAATGDVQAWVSFTRQTDDRETISSDSTSVRWSADGKQVLAGVGNTAEIWDAATDKTSATLKGHTAAVVRVAWSADGLYALTGSDDNTARVWHAETGKERAVLKGHKGPISAVSFSPDGKLALTGSKDGTGRIWDAESGQEKASLKCDEKEEIRSIRCSPDGKTVALEVGAHTLCFDAVTGDKVDPLNKARKLGTGRDLSGVVWSPDGKLLLHDGGEILVAANGREVSRLEGFRRAAVWSPDGKRILAVGVNGFPGVWDVETGKEQTRFKWRATLGMAWSPNGEHVAIGDTDGTTRIWNAVPNQENPVPGGAARQVSPDEKRRVVSESTRLVVIDRMTGQETTLVKYLTGDGISVWSHDQKYVLTWGHDATAQVWDVETKQVKSTLDGANGSAVWSPDSKRLVTGKWSLTGEADTGLVWDAEKGKVQATLKGHLGQITSMAWRPDGKCILTVGKTPDRTARIWDAQTGEEKVVIADCDAALWGPDGKHVLTKMQSGDGPYATKVTARIVDADTGKEKANFSGVRPDVLSSSAFSPDGKRILIAMPKGPPVMWDAASGQQKPALIRKKTGIPNEAACLWRPDGKQYLFAGRFPILLCDAESGEEKVAFDTYPPDCQRIAWSPDGTRLLVENPIREVSIWDTATGKQKVILKKALSHNRGLSWSPDGKRILTGNTTGQMEVWDAETGKALATLTGHLTQIESMVWGQDGKRIYTVGKGGTARVWNAETGKEEVSFQGSYSGRVICSAWSPDSKQILTGGENGGMAWIWDATSGKQLAGLKGHAQKITIVEWSPDGKGLCTVSADRVLRVWDADVANKDMLEGKPKAQGVNLDISSVRWSPDSKRLLTCSRDSIVRIWDVGILAEKTRFPNAQCAEWSSDGTRILTGFASSGGARFGEAKLWDAETGRELLALKEPEEAVSCVAWSPDRKRVLTGSPSGIIRVWEAETGQLMARLQATGRFEFWGSAGLAWSSDGSRMMAQSSSGKELAYSAKPSQEKVLLKGHASQIDNLVWSRDGKLVLTTSNVDGTVRLWDAETGREQRCFKGFPRSGTSAALSPDGKCIVTGTGGWDRQGKQLSGGTIWDAQTGELIHHFGDLKWVKHPCLFSPDGKRFLIVGDRLPHAVACVAICDIQTGKTIANWQRQDYRIPFPVIGFGGGYDIRLDWSLDGTLLLGRNWELGGPGVRTLKLHVWDAATGEMKLMSSTVTLKGSPLTIDHLVWSPDGKQILTTGSFAPTARGVGGTRIWDVETGDEKMALNQATDRWARFNAPRFGGQANAALAAFSPNGKRLVTLEGMLAHVWDGETGREIAALRGHTNYVSSVVFSPDGKRVVTGSADGTARIWEIDAGGLPGDERAATEKFWADIAAQAKAEVQRFAGSTDGVVCLALAPDGKRMVSGSWGSGKEHIARVWEVATGKELFQMKGHTGGIVSVAWSHDGNRILTGSLDGSLRLWDVAGKPLLTIPKAHGSVHAVLIDEAGKTAISCGNDRSIFVWDLATGKSTKRIDIHTAAVRGLAWLPGGKQIASAGFDGTVRISDVETGKEVRKMGNGHQPAAWFVAVSPDGKRIASTGTDKMVRLWDAETGKQIKEFAGHTGDVHGVAFSRCGTRLLSAGLDNTARQWDIDSGKEVNRIHAPNWVTCVAFSEDDAHAVFSCYDKTLRMWKVRK